MDSSALEQANPGTSVCWKTEGARRAGAALAASGLVAVAAWVPTRTPEGLAFSGAAGVLALATVGVAVAPATGLVPVQLAGMAAVWLCVRMAWWQDASTSWVLFGAPLAAFVLAWVLPAHRRAVRIAVIVSVTAALPLLVLTPKGWPHAEHVLGAALQLLVLMEALGRGRRPLRDIARYLFTGYAAPATPVPVEDAMTTDRSPGAVLRGGLWVGLGMFFLAINGDLRAWDPFSPWTEVREGAPVSALVHGLGYWGMRFLRIAGVFLVDVGALRMLGVPARAPVDAPWKSKNFLDYWKRANVYRYKMLSDVYFRNFFPTTGRWMPVGVFAVFMVSAIHHTVTSPWPGFAVIRWGIDGAVSATTAAWRQRRSRAGVKAFVAGKARRVTPRALQVAWAITAAVLVLSLHGFLMELARPDKPLRMWIWQVLPRSWFT